jgi:serine/threonine-protein kinase RsbW
MHDVRAEIDRLQDTVLVAVADAGFDDASTFAVRLALEEAVANAFRHGNREDPEKTVTVRYAVSAHQIELVVEDEGPGFDPGAVPDPTEDANLEIPSGRGIMLMRAYMTSVEIVAPGNRIEMVFRRD